MQDECFWGPLLGLSGLAVRSRRCSRPSRRDSGSGKRGASAVQTGAAQGRREWAREAEDSEGRSGTWNGAGGCMREALKDWAWRYSASATCWDGRVAGRGGGAWGPRDRRVDSLVGAPLAGLRETLPMGEGSTHAWRARGNRRVLSASSGMKLTNMSIKTFEMINLSSCS